MARFSIPDSPTVKQYMIERFGGVDYYNAAANIDPSRSPSAPNMIRDEVGKVRKRMGYEAMAEYLDGESQPMRINGVYHVAGLRVVHAGTVIYVEKPAGRETLFTGMADGRSTGILMGGVLYILTGSAFLSYDGTTAKTVTDNGNAYVPTTVISRTPTGGGTVLEPINLISDGFTNSFYGTASTTIYQLTETGLAATAVTAQVMNSSGVFVDKVEGTDFTVSRTTGKVTFGTAPGVSPVAGVDNVRITAYKTRTGYKDRVAKCTVAALYGVGGAPDRLFLSGNPDYPNQDWHSGYNDATYIPDTSYMLLGQEESAVMGYAIIGNKLAAHKSGSENGEGVNVIVREGILDENDEGAFPIVNTLVGVGAVSKYCFRTLGREPLFLSDRGVYAITAEDITAERYSQLRSMFIKTALEAESDLSDAFAYVWGDYYMLAAGSGIYLLDGLQKVYRRDVPYSNYQYECYRFENVPARVLFEEDGRLYFGTEGGKIYRFFNDPDAVTSYSDDGAPIVAWWDTPEISGDSFYKNKTFRYVAVKLAAAVRTGVVILYRRKGIWSETVGEDVVQQIADAWEQVYDGSSQGMYFDFTALDFGKFSFSTDTTPHTFGTKIRVKKVDKIQFRFKNEVLNEPFGIYAVGTEFTVGNNYKG